MNETLPSISIIIAARPDESEIMAVNAARQLDYPGDKLEIIVARGKQPSVQRNAAMKSAQGELIYFLDDDSMPGPRNLQVAIHHFADPSVKMLGGPNLCPPEATGCTGPTCGGATPDNLVDYGTCACGPQLDANGNPVVN